jgi:hypothetical protein
VTRAKPFSIPKRDVWEAFKRVKANGGAAGVAHGFAALTDLDLVYWVTREYDPGDEHGSGPFSGDVLFHLASGGVIMGVSSKFSMCSPYLDNPFRRLLTVPRSCRVPAILVYPRSMVVTLFFFIMDSQLPRGL